MKCPECETNHPAKQGMRCSGVGCRYVFTFNPKEHASLDLTDGRFLAAIRSASQNDTVYFTRNQLYSAYARRRKYPRIGCFIIMTAAVAFLIGSIVQGAELFVSAIAGGIALVSLWMGLFGKPHVLSHEQFRSLINRWLAEEKPIPRLLEKPALHDPPPDWQEQDIYDYGVERVLIVQHDLLVDLMVRNGVHTEQRVLVISESGYPSYLMDHARAVLSQRKDLPVFILHDADSVGRTMLGRVQQMDLPLADRQIIDLGMTAEQFKRLKRTRQYDPKMKSRELPADALAMSFMLTGLGACFASEMTLGALLDEHARESAVASSSSSFG